MVLQNYQNLIEMTSNMIYIVAFGGGLKCPRKIHLKTSAPQFLADQLTLFKPGGHCVFKWILRGHLKPPPSATI